MSKPKLYYFSVRGRGQFLIALMHYLKIDFENVLLGYEFPQDVKNQCTFSQLPLYIDDDIEICETHAIARYLISKYNSNFLGKSILERAKVDEIVESFWDILNPVLIATFKMNKQEKQEFRKNNKVNQLLSVYEKKLKENKYVAGGDDYTYGDFGIYLCYDYLDLLGYINDYDNYPKLEELRKNFEKNPQIIEYKKSVENYIN